MVHQKPNRPRLAIAAAWFALLLPIAGCQTLAVNGIGDRIYPSNDRDWKPEFASTASAKIDGRQYTLRNIRNCNYLTAEDYVVAYYDRQIFIDQIQTVDYIVVPFNDKLKLAHTMLSFGLDDGTYIALSVEIRREKGEKYSALAGFARQYEVIYVLGDERDVIRLRTKQYKSDVFIYRTVASPEQAQAMFADVIKRVNQLSLDPEFYHTLTNNCTTNLAGHVNDLSPHKIKYNWKILLPGMSGKYAYELGLLDTRIPFDQLTEFSRVNTLADQYFDDPEFSKLIRSDSYKIERYAAREEALQKSLNGRGGESLDNQQPPRFLRR